MSVSDRSVESKALSTGAWLLRRVTGGPEWLEQLGRSPGQLALANLAWLAALSAAFLIAVAVQIAPPRALLLSIGMATAYLALRKPWWFWQHPDLLALRQRLGDTVVWLMYSAIALTALAASMLRI